MGAICRRGPFMCSSWNSLCFWFSKICHHSTSKLLESGRSLQLHWLQQRCSGLASSHEADQWCGDSAFFDVSQRLTSYLMMSSCPSLHWKHSILSILTERCVFGRPFSKPHKQQRKARIFKANSWALPCDLRYGSERLGSYGGLWDLLRPVPSCGFTTKSFLNL